MRIPYYIRSVALFITLASGICSVYSQNKDSIIQQKISQKNTLYHTKTHLRYIKSNNELTYDKSKIKGNDRFKLLPVVSGRVAVEGYKTTFQNPRVLTEPQYIRIMGGFSANVLGLPFLVDFYKTSEPQNLYNTNYFRAKFDYQAFMKGITDNWKSKLDESTSSLNANKFALNKSLQASNALDKQKSQLQDQQNKLLENFEQQKAAKLNSLTHQSDSMKGAFKDSAMSVSQGALKEKSDSAHSKLYDSAAIERLQSDTHRIGERIRAIQAKQLEYAHLRGKIDSTYKADSTKVAYYQNLLSDPEKNATAWLKENGFSGQVQFLSKIKEFQTGLINPMTHLYSLHGVALKGVQSAIEFDKLKLTVAGGKAMVLDAINYNRQNNRYERNVFGLSGEITLGTNSKVQLFGHYIQDPSKKFTEQGRTAFKNRVIGLDLTLGAKKWRPEVQLSLAQSQFLSLNTVVANTQYPGVQSLSGKMMLKATTAYKLNIEKQVNKWATISASTQKVGPKFKSLGNPFMRTNFEEHQVKLKIAAFKGQLLLSSFYKLFSDNVLSISETTNKTSGYGLSLQTRFKNKKLPNFTASISPYEQGNNHPDSLFRVNSQYSIMNAGISYRTGRRVKYFVLVYGSQSNMQFSETMNAKIKTVTVSQDLSIGRKVTIGHSGSFIRTYPSVDSTQSDIHQVRISTQVGKNTSIGLNGHYAQYLSGSYRKGVGLTMNSKLSKTFTLTLRGGFDSYYRMWGIQKQESIWGLCRVEIQF